MAAGEKLYPNVTEHPFIKLAGEITLERSDFEWVTGELLLAGGQDRNSQTETLLELDALIDIDDFESGSSLNKWGKFPPPGAPTGDMWVDYRVVASSWPVSQNGPNKVRGMHS